MSAEYVKKGKVFKWRQFVPNCFDMLCVATVGVLVTAWLGTSQFSHDSWSYFELSKTIFSDFYRVNTFRQYQTVSSYGTSFPPLFPFLLAVARAVCDLGIYTAVLLNATICVATLFAIKGLINHIGLSAWVGNVLFLMLLTRDQYVNEMMSGRSIPLALLILVLLLRVYFSLSTRTLGRAALLGLLAGLSMLTRFDFLASGLVLGLVIAWYARKQSLLVKPVYLVVLAITVSPWVVYSLSYFSKPFVSDNSRTAMLVPKSFVTDYYPEGEQLEFAWDAPMSWAYNVAVERFPRPIYACIKAVVTDTSLLILVGVLVGVSLLGHSSSPTLSSKRRIGDCNVGLGQWGGMALVLAAQVLAFGLTGYNDARYSLSLQFFLALALTHAIGRRVDLQLSLEQWSKQYRRFLSVLCVSITVLLAVRAGPLLNWRTKLAVANLQQLQVLDQDNLSPRAYADVIREIHSSDKEPRILVVSGTDPFRFGALTGCTTFIKPRNLTVESFIPFVHAYQVTHVLDPKHDLLNSLRGRVSLEFTEIRGLVRILPDEHGGAN